MGTSPSPSPSSPLREHAAPAPPPSPLPPQTKQGALFITVSDGVKVFLSAHARRGPPRGNQAHLQPDRTLIRVPCERRTCRRLPLNCCASHSHTCMWSIHSRVISVGALQLQASAAGGSPMSASSHSTAQTDVHALVQKAIRRGYSRSQRGRCLFGAGCAPAAALPRPVLPRAASMPTLSVSAASLLPPQLSPSPPPGPLGVSPPQSNSSVAGVPPMQLLLPPSKLGASPPTSEDSAAALPVAAAPPQALPAVRTAGVLRCWSAADLLAMGGAEMSPAGNQMHARAAAQEQLQAMAEHHLLNNSAAAEDLQQLAKEAAAA